MSRFDSNEITALVMSITPEKKYFQILIAYIQCFLVKESSKLHRLQGITIQFHLI